ncbi:MAG: SWIM zinc finger family protein, partial [Acidimicrobiales bacterium]
GRVSPPRRRGSGGRGDADDWPPLDEAEVAEVPEVSHSDGWEREWRPPIPVEGGIVATTRRGQIGSTWWSRRFLESLETVLVGGRMASGRAYARKGQVIALAVAAGTVAARVQGSREEPYEVRLVMPPVPDDGWARVVARLAAEAGHAARMLAGDLPHEVEEVFAAEGESLLAAPHARLVTSCTCPDFENPCKHIAAVCYLLAEAFDRDPFELLAWRGRSRAAILGELRARRAELAAASQESGTTSRGARARRGATGAGATAGDAAERSFFDAGPELADVRVAPTCVPVPDAVLRQLPRGVLVIGGEDLVELLAPVYAQFSAEAVRRANV